MAEAGGEHSPWAELGVYAERTGQHIDAVRSAVHRGRLNARKGNNGRWLVPMPSDGMPQPGPGDDAGRALAVLAPAMPASNACWLRR